MFTQGPWHIDANGAICAQNGRALVAPDAISGETEEEAAANKRLMAASADLLDCCLEELLDHQANDVTRYTPYMKQRMEKLRAAINKAR